MKLPSPALLLLLLASLAGAAPAPHLKVSENKRFLVTKDDKPFFYLGDTAWELFHRLDRADTEYYLQKRAAQGYTVIQAVALAELDGLGDPTPAGHRPLLNNNPATPDIKEGPDNDYWDHVDAVVDRANALGLVIGFLPAWGDKWNKKWGTGPEILTPENAAIYGEWLGRRYREKSLIWILGGDRPVESEAHHAILRAMAAGLRQGDGGAHLITFHPTGGSGSAEALHDEPWLDFNMRQNGHTIDFNPNYAKTSADYRRTQVKPVIDAEPVYEDHPVAFKAADFAHSLAADVRRPLYWNLFQGAFGHTYGNHCIWQMFSPARPALNSPLMEWREALEQPGGRQMIHGRRLMESRPFLTRIPDDSIIVPSSVPTEFPGAGIRRFVATRDEAGTYAMIYFPVSKACTVRMDVITGPSVRAWWFNPRDGTSSSAGVYSNIGTHRFAPEGLGETTDWILVLDDVTRSYPSPGQVP